ncbi:uncharacterized protein N7511_000151 [Penicillium nucicola]|uniref:uncharacterized protein n=1 Tax=Penicillium nucicola TaxID=1850975 RepID=UPI0025459482|nr:uncharacterized protein N7511_000151 [Penicillium nucicola]KAJ5775140.1 hypothetical protein N7511_000151 [Penicillium nucicola]
MSFLYEFVRPLLASSGTRHQEYDKTEVELEQRGDINALQRLRQQKFYHNNSRLQRSIQKLLLTEFALRRNAQKAVSLYDAVDRQATNFPQQELQEFCLKEELAELRKESWFLGRQWWHHRHEFHQGPLSRAFRLWRSHPQWYMHRTLRDHCSLQGGYCGRDCGCCIHRHTASQTLGVGHCTDECGCCRTARGFEFTSDERTRITKCVEDSIRDGHNSYLQELIQVSIWGLLDNNDENPFDQIESHHKAEDMDDSDDSVTLADADLDSLVPSKGNAPIDALRLRAMICVAIAFFIMYQIS